MRHPVLALDLDGVTVDLTADILSRLQQEGHTVPSWSEPDRYHCWLDPACGLTAEAGQRALDLIDSPHPYLTARPMLNAIRGIHDLLRMGWMVVCVTQRPPSVAGATHAWLEKYGLGDLPVQITRHKAVWASRMGYTLAVDDAPHHLEEYANRGVRAIAFDKPYNQDSPCSGRATDWCDLMTILEPALVGSP